ncbi:putative LRR receptor-like serine/threonine-protein kinase [Dichanthelium oligosanthes]|uniref:Putative LRR receptor-like serine/threonine-protein kinase n=1 Tax=Dichanthelium oligosanthes TaxID=888268 RepID=A0A1E5VYB1_9POAL|nr:putative LRR receptor-like serine/threonine-protein kinase [Dichanthelium oligosanthes]
MAAAPSSLAARLLFLLLLLQAADAARLPLSLVPDNAAADALLKLKSGIKDDSGALGSWSPGTSPCNGDDSSWAGVMCNKDGVHGLQLEAMRLSGTIDLGALKSLPGLRTLSFMDNEFAGPMPDVKPLSGLRAIFLSGNKFSGAIPADAFAGMGSLKKVVLSNNDFSGPIPASLADVPRLLELQLNDNKFQGKIPDLKQQELKEVNLANNELEGEIPASLKSIKPDMFAGNKKLCGAPLGAKCEAPPSPSPAPKAPLPPASDKAGTSPSPPAQDAATSSTGASADDAKREAPKPAGGSTSYAVLAAVLGTLAIVVVAFIVLHTQRDKTKNFGPTVSAGPRAEPHPPGKVEASAAANIAAPAAAAAGGGGGGAEERSSSAAGSTARKVEQGRLTFVRDDRGRFFELQDLLKATAEVLGAANLGVCYRATLTSGDSVVVKRFKEMNRVGREDFEEHMRRLGRLSHPNLLPLVAYYYRKEEKLLIHDFVPNRSLANLLHGEGRGFKKAVVHWNARLKIVKGVARALSYLYDELCMLTVPHGHLKSSNILLDGHYEPLLTDYALVPVMNQSHAAQLMVAFKSPERKQFGRSSKKSDVWCLGLLILEILAGRPATYDPPKEKTAAAGGSSSDLVNVVGSTPEGEWLDTVVDPDLRGEEDEDKEEMVKLIRIGMACCESNVGSRWELKTAVDRIEELKGKEHADQEQSFYSSVNDDEGSNDVAIK